MLLLSSAYIFTPRPICRRFPMHLVICALALARPRAGKSIEARMAMMAMTTSNSIRVKASQLIPRLM